MFRPLIYKKKTYLTESLGCAIPTSTDHIERKRLLPFLQAAFSADDGYIHYSQLIDTKSIGKSFSPSSHRAYLILVQVYHRCWKRNRFYHVAWRHFLWQLKTHENDSQLHISIISILVKLTDDGHCVGQTYLFEVAILNWLTPKVNLLITMAH